MKKFFVFFIAALLVGLSVKANVVITDSVCQGRTHTIGMYYPNGVMQLWSTGQTTSQINVSSTPAMYTVRVVDVNWQEVSIDTFYIVEKPRPYVNIVPAIASICNGDYVTILASGGEHYLWSDGETNPLHITNPSNNITYSVTITGANNCFTVTGSVVMVNQLPTIYTLNSTSNPFCQGGSGATITLSGSEVGVVYQLYRDTTTVGSPRQGTGNPLSFTGLTTAGRYTIFASHNTCTQIMNGMVNVIMNPLPNNADTIIGRETICQGQIVTYSTTPIGNATSYEWAVPNGATIVSGQGNSTITVRFDAPISGDVTVAGRNACGNGQAFFLWVMVNPVPTIAATALNDTICNGASTRIITSGSGNAAWIWNTGDTTANINVTPTLTTRYTVTTINGFGCTATAQTTITVNPGVNATVNPRSQNICPSNTAMVTANGGNRYRWNTGDTIFVIGVTPMITTNYTVTVSNAFGCSDTAHTTVTVLPWAAALVTGNTTICYSEHTTLHASCINDTLATYRWSTNQTTASILISPNITTTYTVTVTNRYGCQGIDRVVVSVQALPTIYNVGSTSNPFCENGSGATITLSGSEPGVNYQIYHDTIPGMIRQGTGNSLSFPGITTADIYGILATNIITGCTSTMAGNAGITMSPLPSAAGTIFGDTVVCEGRIVTYSTTPISNAIDYIWSIPNGARITNGQYTRTITVEFGNTSGHVSVLGQNACGNGQQFVLPVVVNIAPTLNVTANYTEICHGASAIVTANTNGNSFAWSNGLGTSNPVTVTPLITTTYSVTVTNTDGCTNSDCITITVHDLPMVSLTLTEDNFCTDMNTGILSGGVPAGGTYSGIAPIMNGNTVYPSISSIGTYTITYAYTDGYGCTNSATDLLTINPVPAVMFTNINTEIFTDTPPFDLTGYTSPTGGIFTGPGMMGNIFNPAVAGVGMHMIMYTYTHPITGCSATQIQYIPVGQGLGIGEVSINSINIYPNPATNNVNISGIPKEIKTLNIMNLIGEVISITQTNSENMTINVEDYPSGTYIMSFTTAEGISFGRMFVKE